MNEETRKDFLARFQTLKNELIRATTNSILKSTIQFFYDNEKGEQKATGSGLLINVADRYFLLTAAHVIAENFNNIYVILPDKELQLGGQLHFTPLPTSGKREDDKIDIAVMELADNVVADLLSTFQFITLDNIGIGHKNPDNGYYLSVGYPATKTKKVWNKNEISSVPFTYQTEINGNFDFDKSGFSPLTHIAVEFDGKVKSEKNKYAHKAPDLNGISGSGLWFLQDFATPNMVNNKQLVGLLIERVNTVKNKALIATRIELVTEFIRQKFKLDMPKSNTIKVNLK